MKKALIISHSVQSAEALSQLLKIEYFTQISIADNSKTAKKLVENDEFDLICINAKGLCGFFVNTRSGSSHVKYFDDG